MKNALFGICIHARERVIEDQNLRIPDYGAGNCRPLLLSTRKRNSSFPHHRVEPVWKLLNIAIDARNTRGSGDVLFGGVLHTESNVFADRFAKEKRVLGNKPN